MPGSEPKREETHIMRKSLLWLLAIAVLCTNMAAFAAEVPGINPAVPVQVATLDFLESVEPSGIQAGTEVAIATATEMMGYFSTDMWGNNAADMDVRALIHGYSTVAWMNTLDIALDGTAIESMRAEERVYTFSINRELVYNNGDPVTAKDYVFSVLLSSSPQVAEIGGISRDIDHIAGCKEYRSGMANTLTGLRLIDDYTFSVEILSAYLPYFYGLAMLNITPYPLAVIAPGCDVVDDGNGVYISGEFTAELLRETLLNPQTGYVFAPRVTSGPYQLDSYNAQTHTATFTANPNYLGNFEGQKPHIEKITFFAAKNEDMAQMMADGTADIIHKVVDQQAYLELLGLVQEGKISRPRDYLRSGFAYLSFACEQGPTASAAVRNAIALCIDKQAFVQENFVEGMAMPVYGYYGLGQWMANTTINVRGKELATTDVLEKENGAFSIRNARNLLTKDGWTLNEQGKRFAEGKDAVRYRKGPDGLEALTIHWAKIKDSAAANAIQAALEGPFKTLGIGLEITEMSLSEMLPYYYRQTERTYDMFNLASNFTYVFDPYFEFHTEDQYQGAANTSGLKDERLMNLAWELRATITDSQENYLTKWVAFQQRWIELMPMVPLYSNVYFDFVASDIQEYYVRNFSTWSLAMPYVYIKDAPGE